MTIFDKCLKELGIDYNEASILFGVHPRTISRWAENPEKLPEQAKATLISWIRMKRLHLSWRPNATALGQDNIRELANLIAQHRIHQLELEDTLALVKARGGPASTWQVYIDKGLATLEFMSISFGVDKDNNPIPIDYTRHDDKDPDIIRDQNLLQDGYYCIAQKLKNAASKVSSI
jgi:hypothetical protein